MKFNDYIIEHNLMPKSTGMSCNIISIKEGINYKRRYDLEDIYTSKIWIEIYLSKGKPILIGSIYRHWSLSSSINITNSKSSKSQTERWSKVYSKWKTENYW